MVQNKKEVQSAIEIKPLKSKTISVWIKGNSPFIYNAMSQKVWQQLILPSGKKTKAEKEQTIKHNPYQEYYNSTYRSILDGLTRLTFPASGFKAAMATAALEIPGAKKTQIGRLVWVVGEMVNMYGVPRMKMDIVRCADINKTPDVRTRAIVSEWCSKVTIQFVTPTLNETTILNLLEAAGLVIGIGDYRQEKGKGNYGQFSVCTESDVKHIIKAGSREQQDAALKDPEFYDIETEELYRWFNEECVARGVTL